MSSIDERIVEMQFDNKQFEAGIQTSLKSLDNLKKGLNLEESAKSLSNLDKAGKSFSLAGIASGVETISNRFSALGIIGVTALQNITNSAVNAGKRIVSALTIDPVKMGFQEYETQINAVQTILANTESKGKTLTDVNKALDELNAYADKTIYNFTEMTRNIGTFTAAGVDLDTSVAAIKGIANLAAVSGSTSQQASTAMYQLSQALASGTVKLMDWNSVVNAGMGGQVFQDALKETARVHGVAIDDMIESEGSFRETLSKGWLSAEILTETLSKFTGDLTEEQLKTMGYTEEQIAGIMKMGQTANNAATKVKTFTQLYDTLKEAAQSGWTQTWEIIVGDFEEAKVLLTEVSDTIGAMIGNTANARNEMLQGWKDLGGRTSMIESVRNVFQGLMSVITPIKEAFREIFPPMTAEKLYGITEAIRKVTEHFKIGETTANNLKRTFKGVFAVFNIGVKIVSAIAKGFMDLVGFIAPAGNGILGFTAAIGDGAVALDKFLESTNIFSIVIKKITSVLGSIITGIRNFVKAIGDALKGFISVDMSGVDSFTDRLKTKFEPLTALGEGIKKVFDFIVSVLKKCAPIFVALGNLIGKALGGIFDVFGAAVESANFNTILDFINGGLLAGLIVGLKKFIDSLGGIKEIVSDVMKDVGGIVSNIKEIFDGVIGSLKAYQSSLKAKTLLTISSAIAILTASLLVLSTIDSDKLGVALTAITSLFIELFASMAIFEKIMGSSGFKSITKITSAMITLSTAVLILSFAMARISKLDWNGIVKGLAGVAGLCGILAAYNEAMQGSGKAFKSSAIGLIALGTAILILASAVEKLSKLDLWSLAKGLTGVGVLCAELAFFLKTAKIDEIGLRSGVGLIALATALNILSSAVSKFGAISLAGLAKGLSAMAVVLTELTLFLKFTGNANKVFSTATGLVVLASAMIIFAEAIERLGSLNLWNLTKGLSGMAAALLIVAAAIKAMPNNTLLIGTGLVAVGAALAIIASVFGTLGGMSMEAIGKGILALAGSLTILAAAMYAMQFGLVGAAAMLVMATALGMFVPSLLLLSLVPFGKVCSGLLKLLGTFALLGVAGTLLLAFVPGVLAMGAALNVLGAGMLVAGAGVLVFATAMTMLSVAGTASTAAIVACIKGMLDLIPYAIKRLGEGIVEFVKVIGNSASEIVGALTSVLNAVLQAITNAIPNLIKTVGLLLDELLKFIVSYIPKIVDAGMQLIIGLLQGIAANMPGIVSAAVDIIAAFLSSIGQQLPRIVDAGFMLIINFINGMAESIRNNSKLLTNAVTNLAKAVLEAIRNVFSGGINLGKDLIQGIINGISSKASSLKNSLVKTVKNAWNGVTSFLGIRSPSRLAAEAGMYVDEGMAIGLKKYADVAGDAALSVGEETMNGLYSAMSKVADIVNSDAPITPSIRPVIDMSDATMPSNDMMSSALSNLSYKAERLNSEISTETHSTVNHKFDTLRVEGVNNEGEFVAAADYAVEEILTELMRRQNRL